MNYRCLLLATSLCVVSVCASAAPAESRTPAKDSASALDQVLPDLLERSRVPAVAISGIENGQLAWTRVYGQAREGVAADERSVFNAASLTKPVFGLLVLRLIAEGQLDLDQELSAHWVDPDLKDDPRHRQLTPRLLLSHQGGLPNWRGRGALSIGFEPGGRHEYSGEGYEYLRRAIEHGTGRSLQELMQQQVLTPAGMQGSFGWSAALAPHIVQAANEAGEAIDTGLENRGPNAAANLMVSAPDYARFVAWVLAGAGLPESLLAEMQRPQARHAEPAENFGLGWKLSGTRAPYTLWHDGREAGTRSLVIARPQRRDGLVVLSNGSNGELLMRPIIQLALKDGDRLVVERDAEVWRFLQAQPAANLQGLFGAIARSPSFMSTLLHAAHTALVDPLAAQDTAPVPGRAVIDRFVLAMLRSEVAAAQVEAVLQALLDETGDSPTLRRAFTAARARAWLAALEADPTEGAEPEQTQAEHEAATRPVVAVPAPTLAAYAGRYRVPSSNLLITISAAGDRLRAAAAGTPTSDFFPASERLFFMRESATEFEFQRDEHGAVSGIRIIWDGARSEFAPREP
jgi:CubicO group peptidase (beta-lactamase class C family)